MEYEFDTFNQAIRRYGRNCQTITQLLDTLVVHAVHFHLVFSGYRGQVSADFDHDRMRQIIAWIIGVTGMFESS